MKPRALTNKQSLYLRRFAAGWSTAEIGRAFDARPESVANTIERIRRRLGARHNAHLVTIAVAQGLIKIAPAPQGGAHG